jgi:hypothetical protein
MILHRFQAGRKTLYHETRSAKRATQAILQLSCPGTMNVERLFHQGKAISTELQWKCELENCSKEKQEHERT